MDTVGQLAVFRHNGDTLSLYSAQVGIFPEVSQVVLSSLLQCLFHMDFEAQVMLTTCLCYLTDLACKESFMNEAVSTLLELAYLTKSHYPWSVLLGLLKSPLRYSLHGAFPPAKGLTQLVSVLVFEALTSTTILANI